MTDLTSVFLAASRYVRERTEPLQASADNHRNNPASWLQFAAPAGMTLVEGIKMSLGMIVLIILLLALLGVFPAWPHSREWGYGPSGGVGLVVVILVVLLLMGRI